MNTDNSFSRTLISALADSLSDGEVYPITGSGRSMYPFLRGEQDTVYLSSLKNQRIRRGDILLYEGKNGNYVIHRVYKVCKDGTFCFVGDNQTQIEYGVSYSQLRAFVPYICRDGKKISCQGGIHHHMMIVYMRLHIRCPKASYALLAINSKLGKTVHSLKRH